MTTTQAPSMSSQINTPSPHGLLKSLKRGKDVVAGKSGRETRRSPPPHRRPLPLANARPLPSPSLTRLALSKTHARAREQELAGASW